jgi:hypothetical protein
MSDAPTEGWGYISNSRKWHYYTDDGRSLCRKFMKFSKADLEQGGDGSPDNCVECRRRLADRKAKAAS